MKLWIDDERPAPDDSWVACKSIQDVVRFLGTFEEGGSNEGKLVEEISCDYYLDPKNNVPNGMWVVQEIQFNHKYVVDILAEGVKFRGHSSDDSRNHQMEEAMAYYLNKD